MLQTVRQPLSGKPSSRPAGVLPAVRGVCTVLAILAVLAISALPAEGQKITEVVFDHVGSPDTYEYIEVATNPASVLPPGSRTRSSSASPPTASSSWTAARTPGKSFTSSPRERRTAPASGRPAT
ncbi:MAG: hypothetical protein IPP07_28545 [Holophagales bacterium]|nr:hypothetical protein [Holophagales bacterium]